MSKYPWNPSDIATGLWVDADDYGPCRVIKFLHYTLYCLLGEEDCIVSGPDPLTAEAIAMANYLNRNEYGPYA